MDRCPHCGAKYLMSGPRVGNLCTETGQEHPLHPVRAISDLLEEYLPDTTGPGDLGRRWDFAKHVVYLAEKGLDTRDRT